MNNILRPINLIIDDLVKAGYTSTGLNVLAVGAILKLANSENIETYSNVYTNNGYASRSDYLDALASEYGSKVYALSDILGENEDFDGLVSSLEDMEGGF